MVNNGKNANYIEENKLEPPGFFSDAESGAHVPSFEKPLFQDAFDIDDELIGLDEVSQTQTTIIIPTLNEENNIKIIIDELHSLGYSNILVIDGNSDDSTVEVAKSLGVNVLNQDGKGKGTALRQAFAHDALGDWVIMMDADGSMSPQEIPKMIGTLKNGDDVAKGSRFMHGGHSDDMTFIRRMGNAFFVFLVNRITKSRYTDLCYGYAAFRKEALQQLNPHLKAKSFEIETEIFMKAKILGLKISEVPSIEHRRIHGKTNLSAMKDGFKILRTIINEGLHKPQVSQFPK